jgi:hypothetical protein
MTFMEIVEIAGVLLTTLGGGVVIVFAFSNWLGKVWANRLMTKEKAEYAQELESLRSKLTNDSERYKIKLKKSEFIFQRQFEAASEFVALKRSIMPSYSRPEMDFDDACEDIAHSFENIESKLHQYLSAHSAVVPDDAKNGISSAIGYAATGKFKITGVDVPSDAAELAASLLAKLDEAESSLLNQVHSQVST